MTKFERLMLHTVVACEIGRLLGTLLALIVRSNL